MYLSHPLFSSLSIPSLPTLIVFLSGCRFLIELSSVHFWTVNSKLPRPLPTIWQTSTLDYVVEVCPFTIEQFAQPSRYAPLLISEVSNICIVSNKTTYWHCLALSPHANWNLILTWSNNVSLYLLAQQRPLENPTNHWSQSLTSNPPHKYTFTNLSLPPDIPPISPPNFMLTHASDTRSTPLTQLNTNLMLI